MNSLAGSLLIAGPSLHDPNFRRTVLLVGQHDEDGAVGVVLNRALELEVVEVVPELAPLVPPGAPIFDGGPVEPAAAVVIAEFADPAVAEIVAFGSVGFVPPEAGEEIADGIRRARVFAGYAGWGPGQLDAEMAEDAWLVVPAQADDIFAPDPGRLWERVTSRLGKGFEMLRLMPEDPSLN